MNLLFNKALYKLDKGDYESGKKLIEEALETETNEYELCGILSCYVELLYELEEYDEIPRFIKKYKELDVDDTYSKEIIEEIERLLK